MVPTTRIQAYLSRIAGNDTYLPPPITQEEIYLKQIAEQERRQQVEANPTLTGTEPDLTGLEVGGSKFKVPTELPAVTASDNGKTLKVVSGDWTAVDDVYVVTFSYIAETENWIADKTYAEIKDAYDAKKRVYGAVGAYEITTDTLLSDFTLLIPLVSMRGNIPLFCGTYQGETKTLCLSFTMMLSSVSAYIKEIISLPEVISNDDYRVLTAFEGAWGKAPACQTIDYTVTGQPVDGVYPLSSSYLLNNIQDMLTAKANIRATLTIGADTLIMSPVSSGVGYVRYSSITFYNNVWCIFDVLHNNEVCEGRIVPISTAI